VAQVEWSTGHGHETVNFGSQEVRRSHEAEDIFYGQVKSSVSTSLARLGFLVHK